METLYCRAFGCKNEKMCTLKTENVAIKTCFYIVVLPAMTIVGPTGPPGPPGPPGPSGNSAPVSYHVSSGHVVEPHVKHLHDNTP